MDYMNELEKARKSINEIDAKMAELFEERMKASELVANYKKETALSIFDETREKQVISQNSELIRDNTIKEYYIEFLKNTMAISRKYQARIIDGMRVAYCGVPGAYAYIAAKKMFPQASYIPYDEFNLAYEAVEKGDCDVAVLPIENSYAGDVGTVMDLIFSGELYVNQVIDLPIKHDLMACEGATLDGIKAVVSHSQALSQCAEYIQAKGYKTIPYANTALAAEYVKSLNDNTVAAIASDETAEIFGLKILEGGINTSRTNTTRFAAFSRVQNKIEPSNKNTNENFILVFTVKNEAGALAKTLDIIGAHGFNMRNLRSRPMKDLLWNYYFYIEGEGNINTQNGKDMLRALGATCARLKLAGMYYSKLEK